jgi:FKBP-type peptidyl-prolyl cis-trans isomerase
MKSYQMTAVALAALAVGAQAPAQDTKKAAAAPAAPAAAAGKPTTLDQRACYAIGLGFGKNLKEQGINLDTQMLMQGLRDALTDAEPKLTEAEIESTMNEFRTAFVAMQEAKAKQASDKNTQEGKAFLEANKAKPGVKVTPSGLQYQIVQDGQGTPPKSTDTVRVHYKGTLIDGTEFDSSYSRNQPATFPLDGVIKGWTEGLQLVKPGGKIKLFIPSELAYGENGAPGSPIGPNSVLVFDIELLEVVK